MLFEGSSQFFKTNSSKKSNLYGNNQFHSMARANLNKSKKVLTYTTTASKYIGTHEAQNL